MRLLPAVLTLALVSSPAVAVVPHGGASAPVAACTATPPGQAAAYGLSTLRKCDTFADNSAVDTNDLRLGKFHWFTTSPVASVQHTPFGNFTNDGTALGILQSSNGGGATPIQSVLTVGRATASPYYVGTPTVGSFYAEVDIKFNPATPAGAQIGNTPSFFSTESLHSLNGVNDGTKYPFTEIDVMECIPNGTAGQPCTMNRQLHIWKLIGGVTTESCGSHGGGADPANYNAWNTFGILHVNAADNAGTGRVQWFVNNTSVLTCTYTSTTMSCTDGAFTAANGQTCQGSDLYNSLENQAIPFIINAGSPNWSIYARNFHVWQLN